jgi:microcystin-dependent protein
MIMSEPFIGEIRLFSFTRAPVGWELCQGQLLPIAQNDALFSLLGTAYGGDGRTTFALPDLRGRIPLKFGAGPAQPDYAIGQRVGMEQVTLTEPQLPGHSHTFFANSAKATASAPADTVQLGALNPDTMYVTDASGLSTAQANATSIAPTGGNRSHDNMMPTLTVSYCIATTGIYPSRN